jgi:hypothetical protein
MLTAVQEKSDHGMALFSQPMPLMLCKSPHLASFLLLPFLPGPRDEKRIQQKALICMLFWFQLQLTRNGHFSNTRELKLLLFKLTAVGVILGLEIGHYK